nr:unnamed protein product [Callosobruchus analis]
MDKDTEELVSCPYNPCHRIQKKRLGIHLYKCKKQHPNVNLAICDFNATHHVPQGELIYHHQHCPSRKKIEAFIYLEEENTTNQYPVNNNGVETDDNWDGSNMPTYNAEDYCMRHGVLRKLDAAPPSEKKEFQIQERERLKVVESPICDIGGSCIRDENLEKEKLARHAKRIETLKELIRQRGKVIIIYNYHYTAICLNFFVIPTIIAIIFTYFI